MNKPNLKHVGHVLVSCALAVGWFGLLLVVLRLAGPPHPASAQAVTFEGRQVHSIFNVDATQFPTLTADVYLADAMSRPLETAPEMGLVAALTQVQNGVSETVPVTAISVMSAVSLPRRLVVVWDVVDANPATFNEVCLGLLQAFGDRAGDERITVITATDGPPRLVQPLTANSLLLRAVPPQVRRATSTRTEMYDALTLALSETLAAPNTSRAIVIVSDEGGDWRPAAQATKPITNIVSRARTLGVPVHLILHKPGPYSSVMSQAVSDSGGLVQVVAPHRDRIANAINDVKAQMNKGYFRVTIRGNRVLVPPGITHTLALAVRGNTPVTQTRDFAHAKLFFSVQGIASGQLITRAMPLSVTFDVITPPVDLKALMLDVRGSDNAISLARVISPNFITPEVWANGLLFTPTALEPISIGIGSLQAIRSLNAYWDRLLISQTGFVTLQARITDVNGHTGDYAVAFVVPPAFVVQVANTPTQLAEYAPFTPTLLVQPAAWLTRPGLHVTAEVVFDDSGRTGPTYAFSQSEVLLPVPGDRLSFGQREWYVRVRDNLGRDFRSPPQSLRVNSAAWLAELFKWVLGLAGLLAALGLLILAALRLSRKQAVLVLQNRGNIACAYEVQVTDAAGLFGFAVHHGGYTLQTHYQTELIEESVAPAATADAPSPRASNSHPANGRSTPPAMPPPPTSPTQAVAQTAGKVADAASALAGGMASAAIQVPGLRGLFGSAPDRLRDAEMQSRGVRFQAERAERLTGKAAALTGAHAADPAAPANRAMPADADETWRPADLATPQPATQTARLVRVGPPWWRTPLIAPGATQELTLWVRPDWPFVQRQCHVVLRSRPVLPPHAGQTAHPPSESTQTALEIPMPHGVLPVLVLLAVGALVLLGFAWYVWPCLVGTCF